jgi:hypothetical protein
LTYGIPVLRKLQEQCRFPLLGANALDVHTRVLACRGKRGRRKRPGAAVRASGGLIPAREG